MKVVEEIKESCGTLSVVQRNNMLALRNGRVGYSCIYTDDSIYQPILIPVQKLIEAYDTIHSIKNVLVLGGGCCTIPRFLIKRYNNTIHIDSVEYESVIISLTRKYFLDGMNIDKLNLIKDDAFLYIHSTPKQYDFVFVDIYVGDKMPKETVTDKFLQDLEQHANGTSLIVFNAYNCSMDLCNNMCKRGKFYFDESFIVNGEDGTLYIVFLKGDIDENVFKLYIREI